MADGLFQKEKQHIYQGNLEDVHSKPAVKRYMRIWEKRQFERNQQEIKIYY